MVARLPGMKPLDVERILLHIGFVLDRQRGSHRIYVRISDNATVVINWHNHDLKRGTLASIMKVTGLSIEEFLSEG